MSSACTPTVPFKWSIALSSGRKPKHVPLYMVERYRRVQVSGNRRSLCECASTPKRSDQEVNEPTLAVVSKFNRWFQDLTLRSRHAQSAYRTSSRTPPG